MIPRRAMLAMIIGVLAACRSAVPVATPTLLCSGMCSEGSAYSPVAHLFVASTLEADIVGVVLDSGTLRVPGGANTGPTSPPIMRHLWIRAFIAEANVDTSANRIVSEHAWRAIAWSDSTLLADSLRYGEQRSVRPWRYQIRIPGGSLPRGAWLGFSITGDAVDLRETTPAHRVRHGGVRVFVCNPIDVNGHVDANRSTRLARAYSEAC